MKTIKNLKDITTLEVGDVIVFGDLEYRVDQIFGRKTYYLEATEGDENDRIFEVLNLEKEDFIKTLGINADCKRVFPETKSLEALTAIVSALFKEYEKQTVFPRTWEEFCMKNPIKRKECYITAFSDIRFTEEEGEFRHAVKDRNYYISRLDAAAFRALMQLRQLHKAYIKDWEPDWTNINQTKYSITFYKGQINLDTWKYASHPLTFPNRELAERFLTNFKDLIEIAKPLL